MNIIKRIFGRTVNKMNQMAYGATDAGRQRDNNEDNFLLLPEVGIYMVADGMGGYNAGEVASLKAVETAGECFNLERVSKMRVDKAMIKEEITDVVMKAHQRILEMSSQRTEYAGMSSTIAVSFIDDNVLHTCHVGDSRAYVINPSTIAQVTSDHSTVAELVRLGEMTVEEARNSGMRNRITQALGAPFPISPEYSQYMLNEGDTVLICSDGLWEMLSDEEIQVVVTKGKTLKETCEKLIHKANEAGGSDNITVVLIRINQEGNPYHEH